MQANGRRLRGGEFTDVSVSEREQISEEEAAFAGAEDGPGKRRAEASGERHERQPSEGADRSILH